MLRRLTTRLATAAFTIAIALFAGVPAHAALTDDGTVLETQTVPMVLIGFDEEVANANGYHLVDLADGSTVSVPNSQLSSEVGSLAVTPLNTVGGNCGSSTLYMFDSGGGKAAVGTSFTVKRPAVSYQWSVTIAGSPGTYVKNFGGLLKNRTNWTSSFTWTVPASSYYHAAVSTGSYAILNNGGVCYSGGPTDATWVYR